MFSQKVQILRSNFDVYKVIESKLANAQEEAFMVCDLGDIIRKYQNWRQKLPRITPYYAVKCNDDSVVLELLSSLGTNFDCASKGEINKVLSLDVHQDRIIFANPTKHPHHIKHAKENGVNLMTFDNEAELQKIKKLYPNAKMVIRIRYDAKNVPVKMGVKFGCDHRTEAPALLQLAKSLNIDVVGVSFHVGCSCQEPNAYREAIRAAREVFDVAELLGMRLHLLDIGGGYPGYLGTSIDKIAAGINQAIDDFFPDLDVDIISEPGQYFVGSAFSMACNVHSMRRITPTDYDSKKIHNMYYINDGIFSCFGGVLAASYQFKPEPKLLFENIDAERFSSSIWGQTCDSLDVINEDVQLPQLCCGDWLVFRDMGAYTIPISCGFNGFTAPKVYYVVEEKYKELILSIGDKINFFSNGL